MSGDSHDVRFGSMSRGVAIGAFILAYGWLMHQPQAHFAAGLLIAAALQLGVLLLRRYAPAALVPQAIYIIELLADGATVFLFALGVYGGILQPAEIA